jgi:hypothetical protein
MLRWNPAIPLVLVISCAVIAGSPRGAYAGESLGERDEADVGPYFFGDAREVGSLKYLQNVRVTAELGGRRMLINTNSDGHFKLPSFGKDTVADDVTISCTKTGYRTVDISRRRMANDGDAPVSVECLLEPAP